MRLAKRITVGLPALAAAGATLYVLFVTGEGLRAIHGGGAIWLAYLLAMPAFGVFGAWGAMSGNRCCSALSTVLLALGAVAGVFSFGWIYIPAAALALAITIFPLGLSDQK